MCDSSVSDKIGDINDTNIIDTNVKVVKIPAAGLWLDTMPQMPPFLTSDLEIKFEIKTDSSYDIEMMETDTKKHLFIHRGTWSEDDDSVYVYGNTCKVLEKEGDTLTDNSDLCGYSIGIRKNIDVSKSPDLWELKGSDMEFLLEGMDLGVSTSLLGNIPIELKRKD